MKKVFIIVSVLIVIAAIVAIFTSWTRPQFDHDLKNKEVSISYIEVNVRENPNTDSKILDTLHMGDNVTISGYYVPGTGSSTLPEDQGWVELSSGGWIVRDAVNFH